MIELKVDDDLETENLPVSVDDDNLVENPTVIKIIGCGGGGSSAVKRMIEAGVNDVEFYVLNTDVQALKKSPAQNKIPIGRKLTGGLGAGGNPQVGEEAANEDAEKIKNILEGANMVIITAGMGGGTGTGSAPVVAKLAHDQGILTIAVVTTPFDFEGKGRMKYAQEGIEKLRGNVDSLIVIPNEQLTKIPEVIDRKLNYLQAFRLADNVLCQGVQGISEIITVPGEINLDFNDVKAVMKDAGDAILGVGFGDGDNKIIEAAQSAISNPLLENRTIDGAKKLLINICSDENLAMSEVQDVVNDIKASASSEVAVFVGLVVDPKMEGKIAITVIATCFDDESSNFGTPNSSSKIESDVFEYGDFEAALNGTKFSNKSESVLDSIGKNQQENSSEQKLSMVSIKKDLVSNLGTDLYDENESSKITKTQVQEKNQTVKSENSENQESEKPKIDKNDMSKPAFLRNGLSSLSRKIKLTED